MRDSWGQAVERYCGNCGKHIYGYKSADGVVKIHCQYCGMMSVMKKMSRRLIRVDEYAPPGQRIKK